MLYGILQLASVNAQMTTTTYNFNNLTIGNLNGQDNWSTVINSNPACTADLVVGYNQGSGSNTPDNTLGVFFNNSGGNYGRTASRITTTAFPFNFAIGGIMEIEIDMNTAWWGGFFGFGLDVNNNGYIIPGIEQTINYESGEGGFGIYLSQQNTNNTVFIKPDGSKIHIIYDSIVGWNKWKFFLDFDANSGAGAVSLFAKKPNGNWKNISTVQSLNLGLTPGSNDKKDPAKWTKLFVQALGGYSAFDNIVIRQPNTGGLIYQYLVFNNPPLNHLTTDAPFVVHATSSKGLAVNCSITGPATLSGDTLVTLTGDTGVVTITAHQPGNATIAAAQDVSVSFIVINPLSIIPQLDIKNPVDGNVVRSPHLTAIPLSVSTSIAHSELMSITQVYFTVNSQNITAKATNNGYYIAYWTPPAFGTYSLKATALSSGGVIAFKTINYQVVVDSSAMIYKITDTLHFANVANNKLDTTLIFPSFAGTYTKITAFVKYECPSDGCEPWDVIANLNIRGANGDWIELIRYITPYATACGDSIDVTDFASQLQGKIDVNASFPAKSKVTISLIYKQGTPSYKYSWMDKLWLASYPFGSWTSGGIALQPVEVRQLKLSDTNITAAYLRVLSSGHGWGDNNTGNAAEFYDATHNFKINGTTAFTQHLWRTCNPNPSGCMPQSGTWQYNRAGWCPGSIPMLSRYDVSSKIGSNVNLMYEFAPSYVDLCSSQNPNCISGTTCTDCSNTENPRIMVAGTLVTYFGGVPPALFVDNTNFFELNVYPNPSKGQFNLTAGRRFNNTAAVKIYNLQGMLLKEFSWSGEETVLNLSAFSSGIYVLKVNNSEGSEIKKLIIE